jgi:hypothetical protein
MPLFCSNIPILQYFRSVSVIFPYFTLYFSFLYPLQVISVTIFKNIYKLYLTLFNYNCARLENSIDYHIYIK